ncbi:hypothetical protein EAI30_08745 [Romboutsia ilealis]|nr:hypothetical protein [Romboutsia ilealis]
MNREELTKDLYKKIYDEQNDQEVSIEEMEEGILAYYNAAGFNFESMEGVINQIEKENDLNIDENINSDLGEYDNITF